MYEDLEFSGWDILGGMQSIANKWVKGWSFGFINPSTHKILGIPTPRWFRKTAAPLGYLSAKYGHHTKEEVAEYESGVVLSQDPMVMAIALQITNKAIEFDTLVSYASALIVTIEKIMNPKKEFSLDEMYAIETAFPYARELMQFSGHELAPLWKNFYAQLKTHILLPVEHHGKVLKKATAYILAASTENIEGEKHYAVNLVWAQNAFVEAENKFVKETGYSTTKFIQFMTARLKALSDAMVSVSRDARSYWKSYKSLIDQAVYAGEAPILERWFKDSLEKFFEKFDYSFDLKKPDPVKKRIISIRNFYSQVYKNATSQIKKFYTGGDIFWQQATQHEAKDTKSVQIAIDAILNYDPSKVRTPALEKKLSLAALAFQNFFNKLSQYAPKGNKNLQAYSYELYLRFSVLYKMLAGESPLDPARYMQVCKAAISFLPGLEKEISNELAMKGLKAEVTFEILPAIIAIIAIAAAAFTAKETADVIEARSEVDREKEQTRQAEIVTQQQQIATEAAAAGVPRPPAPYEAAAEAKSNVPLIALGVVGAGLAGYVIYRMVK